MERARDGRRRWRILVPAVPLLVVSLGGTHGAAENQATVPHGYAYALAGLAALTLLLRRRAPLAGLSIAAVATGAYLLLDQPYGPILLAGPVWAWCLTAAMPLRRALPWLAGFLVVVIGTAAAGLLADGGWSELVFFTAGLSAALTAGAGTGFALGARQRSEAAARTEIARRAVSEERLAMAQDVHDGIGHSLAVIAMQAGVAAHVLDRDPARARELLATVVTTSREALDGLRADLERMRTPAGSAARRPAPGLADLPVLLDRMRDGGLRLSVTLPPSEGTAPVPPDVGAAAYRIVQESLTNVLRHAGTDEASVRVALDGALHVEVADRGTGPGGGEGGSGIAGMRRRAESVGGRLDAGPRDGGGFLVRAELPA
ncbi:MAG TPA: histidine kinase [Mycobacteriales bacterium]|nr:histidine kinase [Mycobacteriales bacterium]